MKQVKLTEGNILKALIKLALPIMGTSFVQMAYNMTDMIWIGRAGSNAVAAVGTAGFFTWLGMAFILIPKVGAEVGVAQSIGKDNLKEAKNYIKHTIQLNVVFAVMYGLILIIFRRQLIEFFKLGDKEVVDMAIDYLVIIVIGIISMFINPLLTGIYNGYGDSRTPFTINTIGLITNMVLDPIMIFGLGPIPELGVKGAALATILSQLTVTIVFLRNIKNQQILFSGIKLLTKPDYNHIKRIVKLGFPVALQSGLFSIFAMFIARIIANWGPVPIAVQKVGSQIEAISWMTAGGFSTALSAFVGQNYGAGKWNRISKGYFTALGIMSVIGILATFAFIFAGRQIFAIFIPEETAIQYGIVYLRILGYSQLFMCIEIVTAGAFNGLGRTIPPSFIGILFTGLRVPASIILSAENLLGLDGVWWSISISSVLKGVLLTTWFIVILYNLAHKADYVSDMN